MSSGNLRQNTCRPPTRIKTEKTWCMNFFICGLSNLRPSQYFPLFATNLRHNSAITLHFSRVSCNTTLQ